MSGIIAQNSGRHTGLVKASSGGGVWNLIETLTASSDATLDFTSGIDSTYDEYVFKFIDIHPETNGSFFRMNLSADTGSNYNVTKTSTAFRAYHTEDDSATALGYIEDYDLAESTAVQTLSSTNLGGGNDECFAGTMHLFNPSSTTFVKHYIVETSYYPDNDSANHFFCAGYGNTTSAVDAVQFTMSADSIEAGTISLYGIS